MAHDFIGNELSIGDDVVFLNYNVSSASLERGIITRVSEHTAEISGKRRAEYKIIKVNPVKPTMDNTEHGMSPNGVTGDVFAATVRGGEKMKITLEIPNGMRGAFFNGVEESKEGNLQMVTYRLDSSELYDGALIRFPRNCEEYDGEGK